MNETKTRAPRKTVTEFGQALRGFVIAVNSHKLAIKVGEKIGEKDTEKVSSSISGFVRKAGQNSGVVSIRSKELAYAIIDSVIELDPDFTAKGATLRNQLHFENISSANREPGANWLVKLKGGEGVCLKDGPNGPGFYKLVFEREADEETAGE